MIDRLTVIQHDGMFSVATLDFSGKINLESGLCFDEMLGTVARMLVPVFSDGSPQRQLRRPLFLNPVDIKK